MNWNPFLHQSPSTTPHSLTHSLTVAHTLINYHSSPCSFCQGVNLRLLSCVSTSLNDWILSRFSRFTNWNTEMLPNSGLLKTPAFPISPLLLLLLCVKVCVVVLVVVLIVFSVVFSEVIAALVSLLWWSGAAYSVTPSRILILREACLEEVDKRDDLSGLGLCLVVWLGVCGGVWGSSWIDLEGSFAAHNRHTQRGRG